MKREFVLVSQGIEILRTESQDKAVEIVKNSNEDYRKYVEECYKHREIPVDNYIHLYIEDEREKKNQDKFVKLAYVFNETLEHLEEGKENLMYELVSKWNSIIDE